jgi:dethiobiotin synthetase
VTIELDRIKAWVASHKADVLVIETAGGLLSPLGAGHTNLDLAKALAPHTLLLVAPDRLGVLHELTACREVLRAHARELPEPGIILQAPSAPDASTGTNEAEIETLQIGRVLGAFPRADATAPSSIAAAERVLRAARLIP